MGIIKTSKLVHEFIRRDEEGNVESITTALDNVNLDIKEGQFIAILGHNGSGKSTLAKHINALLAPSDGTIWVDGMDVSKEENVIPVRKSAGMVFQNPDNQIIANVVEEDVGFGPENIGVPTDEIWQRVDYALRAVGMTKYRTHSPNKLSGGQKQRVAIAGVVAMEPKCIVFDEPTAMLDPNGRKEVIATAHELNKKKGVTIILITHDLGVVANIADRVAVMYAGDIVEIGTSDEIYYDPRHPYTWALLSSMPQMGVKGEDLFSIPGTPPNLFAEIRGDAFAPRNPQALKIDFVKRPPYFAVSPTHKARTWLLDPRAPHIEPPAAVKKLQKEGL